MQFVIMFLPWIAYAVAAKVFSWSAALALALVLAAAVAWRDHRTGAGVDIIKASGLVFFAGWLIAALAGAPSSLAHVVQVISHGWVATMMWASVLVGAPFTARFARHETPPEVWGLPAFARMNRRISMLWAGSFTVATAAMAIIEPTHVGGLLIVFQVLSIVVPARGMQRYIDDFERSLHLAPVVRLDPPDETDGRAAA